MPHWANRDSIVGVVEENMTILGLATAGPGFATAGLSNAGGREGDHGSEPMNAWRHAAPLIPLAGLAALGVLATDGCSSGSSNAGLSGFGDNTASPAGGSGEGSSGGSGSSGSSSGGSGSPLVLPPEMKAENKFEAPVATGNFVWTANPTSGRVAYINATTFDVQTTPAGNGPTYLAAVPDATHPDDDVAVVINVLSEDATLLRVAPQGALTTQTYASTVDANSWAISASGHWGIAWTDATFVTNPDPTQGFQSVAVMDLSAVVDRSPAAGSIDPAGRRLPAGGGRVLERRLARLCRDRGRDLRHRSEGTGRPR